MADWKARGDSMKSFGAGTMDEQRLRNGWRDGREALFFLAEFVGSALTDMPESLGAWVRQYNKTSPPRKRSEERAHA